MCGLKCDSLRHSMWRTFIDWVFEGKTKCKHSFYRVWLFVHRLMSSWRRNNRGTSNNFIINRRNWKENYCVVKLMQFCWLCDRIPDSNASLFHLRAHKPCKVTANESNSKSLRAKCTAPLTFIIKSHSFYHRVQATMTYRHLTYFSNCPPRGGFCCWRFNIFFMQWSFFIWKFWLSFFQSLNP